jgi:hypothetical protein
MYPKVSYAQPSPVRTAHQSSYDLASAVPHENIQHPIIIWAHPVNVEIDKGVDYGKALVGILRKFNPHARKAAPSLFRGYVRMNW